MWKKTKKDIEAPTEVYHSVVDGLKKIYESKIKPLEELYQFDMFHSPLLNASDFDAKPMVLLLGQYSTGMYVHDVIILILCFRKNNLHQIPPGKRFPWVPHRSVLLFYDFPSIALHTHNLFQYYRHPESLIRS